MRVCLIFPGNEGIGVLYTILLCNSLAKANDVTLLIRRNFQYKEELSPKVKIKELRFSPKLKDVFNLCMYLKKEKFDIVHFEWGLRNKETILFFLLKNLLNVPIVWTAHNIVGHDETKSDYITAEIVYNACDFLIVHSDANKQRLNGLFKINKEKIDVVPFGNFIVLDKKKYTKKTAKETLGFNEKDFVIGQAGIMKSYKGVDILIDAFAILEKKYPNIRLLLAGADYTKEVSQVINEHINKLDKKIKSKVLRINKWFSYDEIELYNKAIDLFILPYTSFNAQSAILTTAFSFSTPVIASEYGAMKETIEESKAGVIIKPTVDDVINSVSKIVDSKNLAEFGKNGFKYAKEKLDWDKIGELTLESYKKTKRTKTSIQFYLKTFKLLLKLLNYKITHFWK